MRRASLFRTDRRSMMLGGVLLAGAVLAEGARARLSEATKEQPPLPKLVPLQVGPWAYSGSGGLVLPEEERRPSIYDQELHRNYSADGLPLVMFLIAYAGDWTNNITLHDPPGCYSAAGFKLSEQRDVGLSLAGRAVDARFMVGRREDRVESVLYWTRIGDTFSRPDVQQFARLGSFMRGVTPDAVLVRMSLLGADSRSFATLRMFAAKLMESASPSAEALLAGPRAEGGRA